MERKNAWLKYQEDEKKAVFDFSEGYRKYISVCKTERECVTETIAQIEKEGYLNLEEVGTWDEHLDTADRSEVLGTLHHPHQKKNKKNKKKCTREACGRKTGKRKERRFGTPRGKKKKSEPK